MLEAGGRYVGFNFIHKIGILELHCVALP